MESLHGLLFDDDDDDERQHAVSGPAITPTTLSTGPEHFRRRWCTCPFRDHVGHPLCARLPPKSISEVTVADFWSRHSRYPDRASL